MHVPDDKNHPLTLLFICRCIQVHGNVQPNKTSWIHPLGTLFLPWEPETTLCPLSHHVPGHFDGKSAHHLGYPLWSSAPKPNVFLPEHLVLCWYLLHNSYSPQDVSELFIREKDHFLCWMSGADVFFLVFGNMDSYLLAAMAIDRYVAICNPLHYVTVMNHGRCMLLLACSTAFSCLHSLLHVLLVNRLTFCASNVIHHFFCDVNPVLKLACSSTSVNEVIAKTEGLVSVMAPFVCIIISYLRILNAVLKIPSAAGKRKAFSTCSSHLTVVTLFYGSICCVYFQPLSSYTVKDRIVTVNYTVLPPMLNPFIYSLRNKGMKQGLEKLISRMKFQMNRLSTTNSNKIRGAWLKGVCVDVCAHVHTHAHTHQHLREVFYGEILFHQLGGQFSTLWSLSCRGWIVLPMSWYLC